MSLVLIKMALQNIEFCGFSLSVVALSAYLGAIDLFSVAQQHEGPERAQFVNDISIILQKIIREDKLKILGNGFKEPGFVSTIRQKHVNLEVLLQNYSK